MKLDLNITQLGIGEKGLRASKIKLGDVVRLLEPFRPEQNSSQEYNFAIVAGIVTDDSLQSENYQYICSEQTAPMHPPEVDELVVYLYEPDDLRIYVDQFGAKALFSFNSNEVC